MPSVSFKNINKIYDNGIRAVTDFSLDIRDGELLVLVGPSGCGKSTLLRMLAGLETVSSGELIIDGKTVNNLSPQQRNIAMVFQNYALYPHMSVRHNLEFPLKMMNLSKSDIQMHIDETAELLGITPLLEHKPKQLSGGQRQRVAMGRAIVRKPRVFIMDEPLSNLDAKLRLQIRNEIAALQRRLQTTMLYVTHDQIEAMTLGDRVAVVNNGHLQQVDVPQNLYDRPANIFVAGFIGNPGMNIFKTKLTQVTNRQLAMQWGEQRILLPLEPERLTDLQQYIDAPIYAGLRPEAIYLDCGSDDTTINAKAISIEALGYESLLYFKSNVEGVETDAELSAGEYRGPDKAMVARVTGQINLDAAKTIKLQAVLKQIYFFDRNGIVLSCP